MKSLTSAGPCMYSQKGERNTTPEKAILYILIKTFFFSFLKHYTDSVKGNNCLQFMHVLFMIIWCK